jgi:hypothetical protein
MTHSVLSSALSNHIQSVHFRTSESVKEARKILAFFDCPEWDCLVRRRR